MQFSDIIATANAWNADMSSALYRFVAAEQIIDREHKIIMLREIMEEIGGEGLNEETLATEKQELGYLANFVQTAPIGEDLSNCEVDHTGRLISMEQTPAPKGWAFV